MKNFRKQIARVIIGTTLFSGLLMSNQMTQHNEVQAASITKKVTITGNNVNARSGPGTGNKKVLTLKKGQSYNYLGSSKGWYKISANGKTVWVIDDFAKITTSNTSTTNKKPSSTSKKAQITASNVNARSGPGTKYSKVATVTKGQSYQYVGSSNGWYKIVVNGKQVWILNKYAKVVTVSGTPTTSRNDANREGEKVVLLAKQEMGKPYVWGATGPNSFDCSGFVTYIMKQVGVSLNRTSTDMARNGVQVSRSQLQAGDLVFFNTTGKGISHVGIYMSDNTFIHCSSAKGKVITSTMSSGYYNDKFVTARRVLK